MKRLILIALILITLLIQTLPAFGLASAHDMPIMLARWFGVLLLMYHAYHSNTLTTWVLVAMIGGVAIGFDMPELAKHLQIVSKIFLRLIKTIIAPLIFATLVVGIAGHSNMKQLGRLGWKSMLYFEVVTIIALFIGVIAINISKAGEGLNMDLAQAVELPVTKARGFNEIILHIFPENIAKSIVEGEVLQIVIFSVIFGVALAMVSEKHKAPFMTFAESLSEIMFKFTTIVMYFAPFGVAAAMAYTVGHMGIGVLLNLLKLLATLYVALLAFLIIVLIPVALAFKISIVKFIKAIAEPVSIAFATTSSEAALPKAMTVMEKFGVPRKIIAFVMPMGYSFNLDGTTLYLSLAAVFVAQAAKIEMSFEQQLMMVFTLMITSKGVAGVPRASLVILMGTASSFGLPEWPIFIIIGIDELMDMARTSVNVIGNCLATAVIAKWEGELEG
jgi:proton glutamate symport protein